MQQQNVARTTNYIMVFDENRDNTYSVQSTNVADLDLGETAFGSQHKDIYLPSNKITSSPLIVQMLLSDDHRQWIDLYKWMLSLKNAKSSVYPDLVRTLELTALDEQNQPSTRFIYTDCFITNISAVQYTSIGESIALTFDITLRYNQFKVMTKDGERITEDYTGD
jgi:hypothetical protein